MARISDSPVGLKVVVRYWERGLVGLSGALRVSYKGCNVLLDSCLMTKVEEQVI